jgi:DNA-binding transcriptional MerR regulator
MPGTTRERRRRAQVDPARLLKTAEVLERYPISSRTLDRYVAKRVLRVYYRPPSRLRWYDPDDIDALWQVIERPA